MGTWMLLALLSLGLACSPECLSNCAENCATACGCNTIEACEVTCRSSQLPCSQACSMSARMLPKPNSITPGLNSAFPEDFELTKAERCKATCQTFCEISGKPGHCPGMCELLFCYQNMETMTVTPSSGWPVKCLLVGTLLAVVGLAVHVKRS